MCFRKAPRGSGPLPSSPNARKLETHSRRLPVISIKNSSICLIYLIISIYSLHTHTQYRKHIISCTRVVPNTRTLYVTRTQSQSKLVSVSQNRQASATFYWHKRISYKRIYLSQNFYSIRIGTSYLSRKRFRRNMKSFNTNDCPYANNCQLESFPCIKRFGLQFLCNK